MPFTGDALAAQQIQDKLKSLQQTVHDIEKKRHQSETSLGAVQKYQSDEKTTQHYTTRLKTLYKNAVASSEQEEDVIRKALKTISEIQNITNERRRIQAHLGNNKEIIRRGTLMRMLLNSAQTLPLFVGKVGEKPPPLCGAIPPDPNYVAKVGDEVLVFVKVNEKDGENWIITEVVGFNHSTNKYEVYDRFKEQNQKTRHTISKRWVIPLPLMRANPETDPSALFPKDTLVMALYPTTTCFYKAIVNKPPATHTDQYELKFEDNTYSEGYSPPLDVAQRFVVPFKNKPKQQS